MRDPANLGPRAIAAAVARRAADLHCSAGAEFIRG